MTGTVQTQWLAGGPLQTTFNAAALKLTARYAIQPRHRRDLLSATFLVNPVFKLECYRCLIAIPVYKMHYK